MGKYLNKTWQKAVLAVFFFISSMPLTSIASYTVHLLIKYDNSAASEPICIGNYATRLYAIDLTVTKDPSDNGSGALILYIDNNEVKTINISGFNGNIFFYQYVDVDFIPSTNGNSTATISADFVPDTQGENAATSNAYSATTPRVTVSPANGAINTNQETGSSSINLTASSNNSNVSYSWSPASGLNTTIGNSVIASPGTSKVYSVIITDQHGCTAINNSSITVTGPCCDPSPESFNNEQIIDGFSGSYIWAFGESYNYPGTNVDLNAVSYILFSPNVEIVSTSNSVLTATVGGCGYNACKIGIHSDDESIQPETINHNTNTSVEYKNDVELFPNPTSTSFSVMSNFKIEKVTVTNSLGTEIYSSKSNFTFDLSNQSKGMYFVTIFSKGKNVVKKVVKE